MYEEKIDILKVLPDETPKRLRIENRLESLQREVGGYIETVFIGCDDPVNIICNEEGKIKGLAPNRALVGEDGQIYDVVCGPFLVTGFDDEGNFTSLGEDYFEKYTKRFLSPETLVMVNGKLVVIRDGAVPEKGGEQVAV